MKYHNECLSILRKFNEHGYPKDVSIDEMTDAEHRAITELINAGYLGGKESPAIRPETIKRDMIGVRPTLSGKMFQDTLEHEISKRTVWGRTKRAVPIFVAIFIAVISTTLSEVIKNNLKKPVTEERQEHSANKDKTPKENVKEH